jgi:RNA binding exosome subunit
VKSAIQSMELVYHVHATEDQTKLKAAVSALLGRDVEEESEELEGHFGNTIRRERIHLIGEDAEEVFQNLVSKMPNSLKTEVASSIESRLDEHSALYLRLDKQALVLRKVGLGTGDSVRVKVKPRIFLIKGGAPAFYRQMLGGS